MATLLAITYPDADRATQAMESVDWSHLDHQIRVKDACWIRKENGEFAVHPWHPVAGTNPHCLGSSNPVALFVAGP